MMGLRPGRVGNLGKVGGLSRGPSLSMDFVNIGPNGDSRLAVTRAAGGATLFDQTGTLQLATANTQRIDHEVVRQLLATSNVNNASPPNTVAASTDVGPPIAGAIVTKCTRVGSGDNNIGTAAVLIPMVGVPVTGSIYIYIPSAWTGTNVTMNLEGTGVVSSQGVANLGIRNAWQRVVTTGGASASSGINTNIVMRSTAPDGAVIYASALQLEYGASATAYQSSTAGVVTTAALGVFVEEPRTNSTRNPRAEGAIAGTPGTLPTNWWIGGTLEGAGVTRTVVGSGTENGIPYIDIQLTGTPNAVGLFENYATESATQVVAASGQTWVSSLYLRLIAGSLANVNCNVQLHGRTSGGGGNETFSTAMVPSAALLGSQRGAAIGTFVNALTAFAVTILNINNTDAVTPINCTLRVGLPQLEQGVNLTSPILPAIGTPAATTRAADQVSCSSTGIYVDGSTSYVVQALFVNANPAAQEGMVLFDDGTSGNRVVTRISGGLCASAYVVGGVGTAQPNNGVAPTLGTPVKVATRASAVGLSMTTNGSSISTQLAAPPTGITTLRFGQNTVGASYADGYIQKLSVWKRLLTDAELIAAST